MWEDPIVKEIHEHRKAMLDEFNGDFRAFFEDLRDRQEKGGRKVVKLPKRSPVESH
jgi:hypothetical protein